jgi:general stress protein YciG
MAGTHEGGQKAEKTIKQKFGKDFYAEIGHKGGESQGKENNPGNFANRSKKEVREAARKGGRK